MKKTNIRKALIGDAPFLLNNIKALADFEKAPDAVHLTLEQLTKDGFGDSPLFQALVLELDSEPVGMALFYYRYSTWKGKSLYLEDLYVMPEHRGNKLGLITMKYLAQFAVTNKCKRFEWQVLDWNLPAIKFYNSLNAELDSEWINCRIEGPDIQSLSQLDLG